MPGLKAKKPRVASVPQLLGVSDLSAGLELRVSPSLLQPNQARLLRNWSLQEPGALVTYPGWVTRSTTSLGNRRIQGGARVYLADLAPFTLATDNGSVYKPSDAFAWGSAVLASRDATNAHFFPYDRDLVANFDGTNIPKKSTDGTTWTQMGIDPPATDPTATAVTGGSLVDGDTYEFSYAYQDDGLSVFGNESATVQQAISGSNLTARVGVTASTDPQVDSINIYARDVTAGESVRRKVGNYPNTTTTHDVIANTWSANDEAPTDHTVPVAALVKAVIWKNRWWAWVGNRLYFTQIFENQSWPALFYIDLPFERGDGIADVAPQGDTLIVFGEVSKPFVIIGQTSLDFEVRPALGALAGAFGPAATDVIESGIVHAVAEGVYIFDGASDRLLSYNIDPGWQDLVQRSTAANLAAIAVKYHGLRKELRIAVPRLYPWGTAGEWILDLNRTRTQETPAWTTTDRSIGGYIPWDGAEPTLGNRGRLFAWKRTTVELTEEATGTDADGSDLVCDWESSTHSTGGYVGVFTEGSTESQPAAGTFTLTPLVDAVARGSQALDIGSTIARYGTAVYGTSVYGGVGRQYTPFVLPMSCEGRTFAVRGRYTGQAQFKLYSYAFEMTPEPALSGI